MALSIEAVERTADVTRSAKASACTVIIEEIRKTPTRTVRVTAESDKELTATYKALMQYRVRHRDLKLGIRKRQECIHLWLDEPDATS